MSGSLPYPHLLSPGRIGSLEVRNRILLTPMGTNLEAEDGTPGERISRFYEERARGGAGLIVLGVTGVAWPAGVSNPHNMGLSRDDFIPPFADLVERLHGHGAKVAVQLQHAGRTALQDVLAGRPLWVPSKARDEAGDLFDALTAEEAAQVTAPYTQPGAKLSQHEMTRDDVAQLCTWFADAAERARRAGLDGAEIHAGHGYVISSFLSPSSNRREDEYGGPLENRARLLLEVIRAVRSRVGADFPLWCRIDGVEYRKKVGINVEDAQETARMAVEAGLDAIHVSAYADPRSGIAFTDAPLPHEPCAYLGLAAGVKQHIDAPVIAVGRVTPDAADEAIREGKADFVAMGRALIADPELPNKLAGATEGAIRPCVYAYRCVGNVFLRSASTCVANPAAGREGEHEIAPAPVRKTILVAGGGPAGLEAARVLALRGHAVTLCDSAGKLGGLGRAAGVAEPTNRELVPYLEAEVRRLGVDVRLECAVTPEIVEDFGAETVVVATGARLDLDAIPGSDAENVFGLHTLAEGPEPYLQHGPRVAVIGGDLIGIGAALCLAERGAEVTVLEAGAHLATAMSPPRRWRAMHFARERGVALQREATVSSIASDSVLWHDAEGAEHATPVDSVVLAAALVEDPRLFEALAGSGREVYRIGDCTGVGYFEGALASAARLGREI